MSSITRILAELKVASMYGRPIAFDATEAAQLMALLEQSGHLEAQRYRILRNQYVSNDYGSCSLTFYWNCSLAGGGNLLATLEIPRKALDDALDAIAAKRPPLLGAE